MIVNDILTTPLSLVWSTVFLYSLAFERINLAEAVAKTGVCSHCNVGDCSLRPEKMQDLDTPLLPGC